MPSGSQSSGPTPTTTSQSQGKQPRSRKAAAAIPQQPAPGRAGSAGGIVLEKEQSKNNKSTTDPKSITATSSPAKSMNATAAKSDEKGSEAAGTNRPKRRPRKLNREPASDKPSVTTNSATTLGDPSTSSAAAIELEALKSRVRGLEAKVEELYSSTEGRTGRSPRRRGKGRKGSSTNQVPTLASTAGPTPVDGEEEIADEELTRLEDELEDARRDLMLYQPRTRPRTKRSTSGDTEYVEEIPRDGSRTVTTGDRQVTLSGSYRIPLPATLSMDDVKSIQNGVSAAQNVAKSFMDQRRAAQTARNTTPPTAGSKSSTKASASKGSSAPTAEADREASGKSWGEWFGGYSVAISRAMKNIEAEAAIEGQKAAQAGRSGKAPVSKKASSGKPAARPGLKGRQSNLSSEQVQGLMS
ncbi:unnamed protein product [Periconia digitata]|uniref:Uncharacterized protein n=1 Tax=Periconia digitata TaxID=1303443 RepID=A0A9W4URC7_9PLEO|nr:unnamed protein product [Periconia digitata]